MANFQSQHEWTKLRLNAIVFCFYQCTEMAKIETSPVRSTSSLFRNHKTIKCDHFVFQVALAKLFTSSSVIKNLSQQASGIVEATTTARTVN